MPSRRRALAVLLVAVALGLAAQPLRPLPGTDAVGTLAYAAAAVGVVALLLPRRGVLRPGGLGTAAACAVELAQLTGLPARAVDAVPGSALLLGSVFSGTDLALLVVGGVLATAALAVGATRSRASGPAAG